MEYLKGSGSTVMEGSLDSQVNIHLPDKTCSEIQAAKKGKFLCKTVVTMKIVGGRKHKNEGPPSDSWSWRKYGQKPIKGSPYPRGYYRCSTSKGCPAKKQVERCRTDASRLLITYSCTHNHPGPSTTSQKSQIQKLTTVSSEANFGEPALQQSEQGEQERTSMDRKDISTNLGEHFHYLELHDVTSQIDHNPFSLELDNTHESLGVLFDEVPASFYPIQTCPKPESDEYDFFDELEELPLESLPFRSIMTSWFYDDRILVQPS